MSMNDSMIEVEDRLRIRFPGREAAFVEGVEIGLVLADLAQGYPDIVRKFRPGSVVQVQELARHFGYRCLTLSQDRRSTTIRLLGRQIRPKLRVVSP
jgi:hypothetical protein